MATISVGQLVWWNISETKGVSRQSLIDAAQHNNIPINYLPREINPGRAFKRALHRVESMNNKGEKYAGLVLTKVSEDSTRTVFTIHERNVDKINEDVQISQEDRIVFLKENCHIDFGQSRYADQVRQMLADCLEYYTANDIRSIVTSLIKEHIGAVPARESGAVYFVPQEKAEMLDNIQGFIKHTTGGSIQSWPVYEEKKYALGELCSNQFKQELTEIATEAIEAVKNASQARVVHNRIDAFKKYRNKVKFYAELLDFEAKSMLEKVDILENQIASVLVGE